MLCLLLSLIIFFEKEGFRKETNADVQVTGKISCKDRREKEITEISRSVSGPLVSGASEGGEETLGHRIARLCTPELLSVL